MKIAIAGYGVEGKSNYAYWSRDMNSEVTIVDEKIDPASADLPEGAQTLINSNAFSQLDGFDVVIRSPGLAPYKITTNGKLWSATNEFFAKCPAQIIGVTGSKGKGTTVTMITSILEAAGKKVWTVGNIGVPALDILDQVQPDDIVVYELSSFQLWDLETSPHTAVVLFIEQEHLDVHRSMEEYVEAKAQITRHQTPQDTVIYNAANDYARSIGENSQAIKIGFPAVESAHVENGEFYYGTQKICSVDALQLVGAHNVDNTVAAIDAIWQYTQDVVAIEAGIRACKGLPHRLAYVKTVNDVEYYDDSIATTPTSAVAALRAFANKPKVIILGGSFKGSDFTELARELLNHDVEAVLIGQEAETIAHACETAGFKNYEIMQEATAELFTKRAAELAKPGSVVLLSPASASFDLFKNYADRGDQFIAAVNNL